MFKNKHNFELGIKTTYKVINAKALKHSYDKDMEELDK